MKIHAVAVRRRDKRIWFVCLGVFAAVAIFTFLAQYNDVNNDDVKAASLANFDPGYIISDYQMGNYTSMTEAEIQTFLTSKNPCNNKDYNKYQQLSANKNYKWHWENGHFVCLSEEKFGDGEVIGSGETAAHIIWKAAQDYKINPQVILVLLQKETSLITDPIPNDGDYRKAAGYGCPDNAACSSKYYGFKNQVRNAAALFRTVLDGGWTNYPLGKNYIQYNPNSSCGGSTVNIRSLATSALYRYTPYQPNAGALAAGYGTASCGAYGNRNFYLYFQDWFGGITDEGGKVAKTNYKQTLPDGLYQIVSKAKSGMVWDVYGGVDKNMKSGDLGLWDGRAKTENITNQTFNIKYDSSTGYYNIINPVSGLYLGLKDNKNVNMTDVVISEKKNECGQQWLIERTSDNYYMFISKCSGRVINLSMSDNNIVIYDKNNGNNQKWSLRLASDNTDNIPNGTYKITSALDTNYAMDVYGGVKKGVQRGRITLYRKKENTDPSLNNQLFDVTLDTETGFYSIVNHLNGGSFDVAGSSLDNAAELLLWEKTGNCNQKWIIEENSDGSSRIISVCSGKSLDLERSDVRNGTAISQYQNHDGKNQRWIFEKATQSKILSEDTQYYIMPTDTSLSNKTFDIYGGVSSGMKSGTPILWDARKSNNANQLFRLDYNYKTNQFIIYNSASKLYLDVFESGKEDGSSVILFNDNGGSCNQRWRIIDNNDNTYSIQSVCSGKYVAISSSLYNGSKTFAISSDKKKSVWRIVEEGGL